MIDKLTYHYKGNQVIGIDDAILYDNEGDFLDNGQYYYISHCVEYEYDANGNLTKDLNKGIISITYNELNLPETIDFGGNSRIQYDYDALGTKRRQTTTESGKKVKTINFIGNFVYENDYLAYHNFDEGRIVYKPDSSCFVETYLKDHLGNIRVTYANDGVKDGIRQVNAYYPFGMNISSLSANSTSILQHNEYLYNGKMFQDELGLNWLDYGARFYDPVIGRWHSVDPLAEKYPSWSPAVFVFNNPIILVDPDGLTPRIYVETQGLTGHAFVTVGEGKNTVVYTYGRYAELGKDKSSARSTTPIGEGVLIRLTGKNAQSFIKNQMINNEARAYEFSNADDSKVAEYFEKQFNTSDKVPTTGPYKDDSNARVVDTYDLFENNCTTKSTEAIKVGTDGAIDIKDNAPTASSVSPYYDGKVITPIKLNKMLQSQSKSEGSGVREVKYEEIKKELNLPNGAGGSW